MKRQPNPNYGRKARLRRAQAARQQAASERFRERLLEQERRRSTPALTPRQREIAEEHADELRKDGEAYSREGLAAYLDERAEESAENGEVTLAGEIAETAAALRREGAAR